MCQGEDGGFHLPGHSKCAYMSTQSLGRCLAVQNNLIKGLYDERGKEGRVVTGCGALFGQLPSMESLERGSRHNHASQHEGEMKQMDHSSNF